MEMVYDEIIFVANNVLVQYPADMFASHFDIPHSCSKEFFDRNIYAVETYFTCFMLGVNYIFTLYVALK